VRRQAHADSIPDNQKNRKQPQELMLLWEYVLFAVQFV
jgi:hypothetical protein